MSEKKKKIGVYNNGEFVVIDVNFLFYRYAGKTCSKFESLNVGRLWEGKNVTESRTISIFSLRNS